MSQKALYWINNNWESLEVDNSEFLDNLDSTDFSLVGHKHFKSDITDIPGNATTSQDGFMSAGDKTKLNTIDVNANNYVHPNDANTRHVTDALINKWNAYETTINSLKLSVSNGKTLVASAITAKGISSSGSDTFQQMHDKILSIESGGDYMNTTLSINRFQTGNMSSSYKTVYSLNHSKGGIVEIYSYNISSSITLAFIVDGVTICEGDVQNIFGNIDKGFPLKIPFKSSVELRVKTSSSTSTEYFMAHEYRNN